MLDEHWHDRNSNFLPDNHANSNPSQRTEIIKWLICHHEQWGENTLKAKSPVLTVHMCWNYGLTVTLSALISCFTVMIQCIHRGLQFSILVRQVWGIEAQKLFASIWLWALCRCRLKPQISDENIYSSSHYSARGLRPNSSTCRQSDVPCMSM